jgi:hypothetical protein
MFYKEFRPHYLLQPFVDCIWIYQVCSNDLIHTQIIPPDESIELIFSLGTSYKRSINDLSSMTPMSRSHIIGLKRKPHFVSFPSATHLVGIRIKAGGLRALISFPAEMFTDCIYDLQYYFGRETKFLEKRLLAAMVIDLIVKANYPPSNN